MTVHRCDFAAAQQHPHVVVWSPAEEDMEMCVRRLSHTGLLTMALGYLKHVAEVQILPASGLQLT